MGFLGLVMASLVKLVFSATKQGTKVDARYGAVGEFLAQSVHVQLCASVAGLDSHTPPASAPSLEGVR